MKRTNNRVAISVRFNQTEQNELQELMEFWETGPKEMLKLCFKQMVTSTRQLKQQLKEKEQQDAENSSSDDVDTTGMSASEIRESQVSGAGDTETDIDESRQEVNQAVEPETQPGAE